MWSRSANVEPMSIVQNQKLRRSASVGERLGSSQPCRTDRRVIEHVLDPVDEHRHPADAAFGERDLDVREPGRHLRPQPVGRGDERVHREQTRVERQRRAGRTRRGPRRRAVVQTHDRLGLLARAQERVPVRVDHRRAASGRRILREADRLEAPLRVARGRRPAAISGSFNHASCNGMTRSGCGPAHSSMCQSFHARKRREPELVILALREDGAREAGDQRREAQASRRRRRGPCRRRALRCRSNRAASRRSGPAPSTTPPSARPATAFEPDLRIEVVFVHPGLAAVVERDDVRRAVLQRARACALRRDARARSGGRRPR